MTVPIKDIEALIAEAKHEAALMGFYAPEKCLIRLINRLVRLVAENKGNRYENR